MLALNLSNQAVNCDRWPVICPLPSLDITKISSAKLWQCIPRYHNLLCPFACLVLGKQVWRLHKLRSDGTRIVQVQVSLEGAFRPPKSLVTIILYEQVLGAWTMQALILHPAPEIFVILLPNTESLD